jgi:putative membrane protein
MSQDTTDRQLVTLVLIALGALLVLPLLMGFGMMGFGSMMGGMWGGGMWGNGGTPTWLMGLGVIVQLVFLAVVVGVGYLVYRAVTGAAGPDRATQELRLAYARGDLSDEEYEQRRDALERDT